MVRVGKGVLMAHKDLRKISKSDERYWEELLRREGLTPAAGGNRRLQYFGNTKDLESLEATGRLPREEAG
jgi:hypothetical protein